MLKSPTVRRRISLGLLATGGVLFLLAPENAWISLIFLAFGVLLETLGFLLGHSGHS
jgi:hypothetical protein